MSMKQEHRIALSNGLVAVGLLVMVVMAVMPLLNINQQWMRWAFAAGAFIVLMGRALGLRRDVSLRARRLYHLLVTSALLYCASAAMMFYSSGTNDWIAFLLGGVAMQLYASWMIDREAKKSANSD